MPRLSIACTVTWAVDLGLDVAHHADVPAHNVPVLSLVGADIEDADGGADPVRRLLLLQGVEQRVIDVGRVVDDLDAVFEAERDRLGGAGVRGQPLAARVRDLGGGGDLVLGHGDVAAAPARPLAESVARGRYLDHIHALGIISRTVRRIASGPSHT